MEAITKPDDSMQVGRDDDVPDFLRLEQIPVNYIQQVETDLLEPVVFTQGTTTSKGFARFTLQNKGFLHSHSKLFMSVQANASMTEAFFQPQLGIGQIIQKAVLKIGNKTLNELDAWDGLFQIKSALITNENNKEREQFMTGRVMNMGYYNDESSDVLAADYGLDNGMESVSRQELQQPTWAEMRGAKPAESPTYMVDLSDLFPFLKVHQLPLYMIKEPINIELTFKDGGATGGRVQGVAGDPGLGTMATIDRDELKFCADYIFYGASDEMARFAAANKDMSFSFVDYRVNEQSLAATSISNGLVRNLGMANRLVSRILTTMPATGQADDVGIINGDSALLSPAQTAGQTAAFQYNIRYNDRFEYTTDVSNVARVMSEFTRSEGIPFVARPIYSGEGENALTDVEYQGYDQDDELVGTDFILGTRLSNGRVGQRGVELHLTGDFDEPALLRVYCEYMRVARLSDGMFEVYNA